MSCLFHVRYSILRVLSLLVALKAGRFLAGFLSFAAFIYMTAHGANYYRLSLESLMELDASPKPAEFLLAVCKDLAAHAAQEREYLAEDENGCVQFTEDIYTELSCLLYTSPSPRD